MWSFFPPYLYLFLSSFQPAGQAISSWSMLSYAVKTVVQSNKRRGSSYVTPSHHTVATTHCHTTTHFHTFHYHIVSYSPVAQSHHHITLPHRTVTTHCHNTTHFHTIPLPHSIILPQSPIMQSHTTHYHTITLVKRMVSSFQHAPVPAFCSVD